MQTGATFSVTVAAESSGERLDRFLADHAETDDDSPIGGFSRSRIKKLIANADVLVNGAPGRPATRLRGTEQLTIHVPPPVPLEVVPEPMALDLLYEDEHLLAVNKPPGLVVHPGAGHARGTLVHGLLAHCQDLSGIGGALRPGIVHRLDRGTSGVMVVAKSDRAHEGLAAQFSQRQVVKRYCAFVIGVPTPASGRIDTFFGRHPTARKRFTGRLHSGRKAVTTYELRRAGGGLAELEIGLETGRTHQIRVHLSELGHPVVGDPLYGARRLTRVSGSAIREAVSALGRQALHAAHLELRHPIGGAALIFDAPLADDLTKLSELVGACRSFCDPV